MGNIVTCCIKFQVKAFGLGDLDPNFVYRCTGCGARQYMSPGTPGRCSLCGSECQMMASSGSASSPVVLRPVQPAVEQDDYWGEPGVLTVKIDTIPDEEAIGMQAAVEAVKSLKTLLPRNNQSNSEKQNGEREENSNDAAPQESAPAETQNDEAVAAALSTALDAVSCPVCLEMYSEPSTLPCGHSLCQKHLKDLPTWTCPVCRAGFAKEGEITQGKTMDIEQNETLTAHVGEVAACQTALMKGVHVVICPTIMDRGD